MKIFKSNAFYLFKGIRNIVLMLGAFPLPNSMGLTFKFMSAIKERVNKKGVIMIYPEAHIWPYYTDIRNFRADSFVYPVETNKPVFCFTNVYKKRIIGKRPKVVTYIDGPFYPDQTLTKRENIQNLRDKVYETMKKGSNRTLNMNISLLTLRSRLFNLKTIEAKHLYTKGLGLLFYSQPDILFNKSRSF